MNFDAIVLTDEHLLALDDSDWYSRQVHLEDGLVLAALERQGLRVSRLNWSDPSFDWSKTRSAVFRTTWDYFHRFSEFSPWLDQVTEQTRLFNDADLIRWNIDKHYLGELSRFGVHCVPTLYVEISDPRSLTAIVSTTGWDELILKPVISGNARHTYRFHAEQASSLECKFGELIKREAMMLQPFQRQVLEQGELSLMVIDGQVTHAIRKTPKHGDFRVQDDWGGLVHEHQASADEIVFAEASVRAVPFDVLYARVDLIRDNHGHLALMELEMVEPELFFRFRPEAADRFAAGLVSRLHN